MSVCPYCEEVFTQRRPNQVYCCRDCQKNAVQWRRTSSRRRAAKDIERTNAYRKRPETRDKRRAQQMARRSAPPKPMLCQDCGSRPPCDKHHPDYDRPTVIVWLCRSCHMKRHAEERQAAAKKFS